MNIQKLATLPEHDLEKYFSRSIISPKRKGEKFSIVIEGVGRPLYGEDYDELWESFLQRVRSERKNVRQQ